LGCCMAVNSILNSNARSDSLLQNPASFRKRIYPKERKLIEETRKELAEGRRCQVFAVYTQKHDLTARLQRILSNEGLRTAVLRATGRRVRLCEVTGLVAVGLKRQPRTRRGSQELSLRRLQTQPPQNAGVPLVACRSEFVTAAAAALHSWGRSLPLSVHRYGLATVTTDAKAGNGRSATGH